MQQNDFIRHLGGVAVGPAAAYDMAKFMMALRVLFIKQRGNPPPVAKLTDKDIAVHQVMTNRDQLLPSWQADSFLLAPLE
jgi:hypothetical protein